MTVHDLDKIPTAALLTRTLESARAEPVLQSDDYWAHVRALHFRAGPDVFAAAVTFCSSADWISRAIGADILAQLGAQPGGNAEYPFADQSVPILVSLLGDGQPDVIASALYALGHLGLGEPTLLAPLAQHVSEEVRGAVAYALGGRADSLSIDTLIHLSRDPDLETRNWATFALGALSEEDSSAIRDALAANLTDADDEVRGEAIAGLAKRLDGRAVQPILSELEQPNVIGLAIEAAEALPHSEFLPQLERLQTANPDDEDIQRAVVRCRDASSRNANDQSDA
ncbi:MAG: HEAT repeat domain-containing protein [Acidobacteriota bacterium]